MDFKKQVLFVCKANIGRSQLARGFFQKYNQNPYHTATSAGTHVGQKEGLLLGSYPGTSLIINMMDSEEIDLRNEARKQLTEKLVEESDLIIVMNEYQYCPDYLNKSKKAIRWNIPDPKLKDRDFLYETKEKIKKNVLNLIERI